VLSLKSEFNFEVHMATTDKRSSGSSSRVNKVTASRGSNSRNQPIKAGSSVKITKPLIDYSGIHRRQKTLERCVLGVSLSFVGLIAFAIFYDDGVIFDKGVSFLQSFESDDKNATKGALMNCQNPKNINTPYCQDRITETENSWNSIVKHDKKSPAFTLHGR